MSEEKKLVGLEEYVKERSLFLKANLAQARLDCTRLEGAIIELEHLLNNIRTEQK